MGSIAVTSGGPRTQVRAVRGPDLSDSQADSGSSILVTCSTMKAQVSGPAEHGYLSRSRSVGCLAGGPPRPRMAGTCKPGQHV